MAEKLFSKTVENLKPGAKRKEVPDGHTRGLAFVLQPTGKASWVYRYRVAGKSKKLTIGPYPNLGLADARKLASEAANAVARGIDPAAEKQYAKAAARNKASEDLDLIENVVPSFIERHAKNKTRENSWRETERLLNREVVSKWRGRHLASIQRKEVQALLDKIMDRKAPVVANRTLAALRRMCNWAIERQLIEHSPCDNVKAPAEEKSRKRVLSHEEIKAAWAAFEGAGLPFGPMAKLLLLTGARLSEVAEATWSEIDLARKLWVIPEERVKNGLAHEVPLSDLAMSILETLPKIGGGKGAAGYVFTTTGKTPVSGFSRAKAQFDKSMLEILSSAAAERGENVEDVKKPERWVLHDLRRTAASGMGKLGILPHVIEATLNHKSGEISGIAAVYNRNTYEPEKRAALDAWARFLDALVTGKQPSNVIELSAARQ